MPVNNVDACINSLRSAKTDNEKFAALLMVVKVTKAEQCSDDQRKALFDAIGFKFLKRLLKTDTIPDGCSKLTYKCIAVAVLGCFCSDAKLAGDAEMLEMLPIFNNVITSLSSNVDIAEEERHLGDDTYQCLTCIAGQQAGIDALIQHKTVNALCQGVSRQLYGWQKAHQLLMYLNNICGSEIWRSNQEGLNVVLSYFSEKFKSTQDEEQFGYCRTLFIILFSIDASVLSGVDCSAWSQDILSTLSTILQSKISADQREPALKLASATVDLLGVDWLLGNEKEAGNKLLLLLVHLCCIEVRITLEQDDYTKIESQGTLLCSCFKLLENMISYLSVGTSLGLDEKQVHQLHSAMMGAFNAVIFFLQANEQAPLKQQCSALSLAAIRVLGSWIAEETSALQKQVIALLPFLLKISKITFEKTRKHTVEAATECATTDASDDLVLEDEEVEDMLKLLVPGLCHLSADDGARSVFIACRGHQLLTEYFRHYYDVYQRLRETESESLEAREIEVSLTTVCGVFLNLVVMETSLVGTDPVFTDLLDLILKTVPKPTNKEGGVVLTFNMCVLCLMLLRHHITKPPYSESATVDPFLSSAISLLRCHRHTEARSGGAKSELALKDPYVEVWDDVSDLWFLGIQALCALLPLYRALEGLLLKSGWIPSLINSLLQVEGRQVNDITRDSYGMLLYEFANLSPAAKSVIQEKDGARLAQMYGLKTLSNALS